MQICFSRVLCYDNCDNSVATEAACVAKNIAKADFPDFTTKSQAAAEAGDKSRSGTVGGKCGSLAGKN